MGNLGQRYIGLDGKGLFRGILVGSRFFRPGRLDKMLKMVFVKFVSR